MIGCLREALQHVITARISSCTQILFGGINLACKIYFRSLCFRSLLNEKIKFALEAVDIIALEVVSNLL